jgi:hypothetical protein
LEEEVDGVIVAGIFLEPVVIGKRRKGKTEEKKKKIKK